MNDELFKITKEWLDGNRTVRGGYTDLQIKALGFEKGISTKNWKKNAVGLWISAKQKLLFESVSQSSAGKSMIQRGVRLRKEEFKQSEKMSKSVGEFRSRMSFEFIRSDQFLETFDWLQLRMKVFASRGNRCECCGASPKEGAVICVDHIKPRKFFPELALNEDNLQILCSDCNHGKGNGFAIRWG